MDAAIARRHIDCTGAFNIRDLGGYPTVSGHSTRWGTLYRADGLHRVQGEAAGRLVDFGWKTVLDLRTFAEVDLGAYRADGVDVIHLPVLRQLWEAEAPTDVG